MVSDGLVVLRIGRDDAGPLGAPRKDIERSLQDK